MGDTLVGKLLNVARLKVQMQGEFSRDMIPSIVEDVIDEFMREGLISDDENLEGLKIEVAKRLEQENF